MKPINLASKLSIFSDHFQPRTVGEFSGHDVMVVKERGEFPWHKHDDTDVFFLVLRGTMVIRMRDSEVTLNEGEMFIVPKGIEHSPVAEEECHILNRADGDTNTGDPLSAARRQEI